MKVERWESGVWGGAVVEVQAVGEACTRCGVKARRVHTSYPDGWLIEDECDDCNRSVEVASSWDGDDE